jgi:Mg2+ and Co2+ transporter CorA
MLKTTCYGVKWPADANAEHGEVLYREFEPKAGESWLWIDEEIVLPEGASVADRKAAVLEGEHEPEIYAGYDVKVGEQPIIMTTPQYDHLILPNIDVDTEGDELVSLIVRTHCIETRHAGPLPLLAKLRTDATFVAHSIYERTSAFLFVSIMQLPLDQLDARLFNLVDDVSALEENIAARAVDRDDARMRLMRFRGELARYRKLYEAYHRVVDVLFDPRHGAFGERLQCQVNVIADESRIHFTRLADHIDRALGRSREIADSLAALEAMLRAQQSDDLNKVLLVLTIASTCALPLIFVTGFFGMNVQFPGRDDARGLLYSTGLMLLISIPLWIMLFRWIKRKWHGRG